MHAIKSGRFKAEFVHPPACARKTKLKVAYRPAGPVMEKKRLLQNLLTISAAISNT